MTAHESIRPLQPALLDVLEDAVGPGGTCELDAAVPEDVWNAALVGPAAAFLVRPGKDLRARLVRAGWLLGGGNPASNPDEIAQTIELIHAGSLIVDDVEDASDTRRGAPTLHRLVGEPVAINTGTWMYFWALAELGNLGIPGAVERAVRSLARCHQGQALDLATCIVDVEMRSVPAVVAATTRLKTGALCRLATELGAIAAGACAAHVDAIGDLGESVGCALQMLDDLGCLAAPERHEKACEDLRAGRPTWPWAWLAEEAEPFVWARLVTMAKQVIGGADAAPLIHALAERVVLTGRRRVSAALDSAIARVRVRIDAPEIVDSIAADLRRMEAMYG